MEIRTIDAMEANSRDQEAIDYLLISFLDPGSKILAERLIISINDTKIAYLRSPLGIANSVILRGNNKRWLEAEIGPRFYLDNQEVGVKFHSRIISKQFALYLAFERLKPYLSDAELRRLNDQSIWHWYFRCIAGELPRPLRNNKSNRSFYCERACSYDSFSEEEAVSLLHLYSGAIWLDNDCKKTETVSIIIPVYGQLRHTACCLLSIYEERRRGYPKDQISIQVIVVDDCSPVAEDVKQLRVLSQQGLIKLLSKSENSGFIESCNAGADAAGGKVLIFLNNDIEVLDQWLEEIISPLENTEIGMTGSKFLYPDGSLQEAGGIIWSNGNAWNYGRGSIEPFSPEYTYIRDVDYISGASIAVRRKDFVEVGAFSKEFRPAYCEDSDLALKIRHQLGKKIIFNPFSMAVHYEGKSCGTDLHSGIKKYQIDNTRKLFEKWKHILSETQLEDATDLFHARGRSSGQVTILIIDHYIPEPDRDAGSRTMHAFIKALKELDCRIVFWPDNLYASQYCRDLQKLGVEVYYFTDNKCPTFEGWLSENCQYIDIALISRPEYMVKYAPVLKMHTQSPIVFYGHDLHHRRTKSEHSVKGIEDNGKELEELRKEKYAWNLASLILYPTYEEVRVVEEHLGPSAKAQAIQAYSIESTGLSKQMSHLEKKNLATHRLLFVGGFRHAPNVDAMMWFCRSILPIISDKADFTLTIAGSNPSPDIQALESEGVTVRGFVSDEELEKLYGESDIVVVPLRYGAGIKGKVIEAFSKCIPVVTTSIGLQGIDWEHRLAYVGDSDREFADALLEAMHDVSVHADRSQHVTRNALSFVKENYSSDSMVKAWSSVLKELIPRKMELVRSRCEGAPGA